MKSIYNKSKLTRMKLVLLTVTLMFFTVMGIAQQQTQYSPLVNTAQRLINNGSNQALTMGGYGEINYNQPSDANGELDVQRLVLLFAYKFNDKTQFVTEVEFEHVQEVYVEQAFVNHNIADNVSLRGGLMLIPMGILNEYHEPTTFNGVERPGVDNRIVPTTWREIGVGVNGRWDDASIKYQAYIFNGFNSVLINDGGDITKGLFGGAKGFRGGRQKGIQSTISSPNYSFKVDYFGVQGLKLGLSGYFGDSQVEEGTIFKDEAKIGMKMFGLDARYVNHRFSARGQFIQTFIDGAQDYNDVTGSDLGDEMQGWYLETAYNLLPQNKSQKLDAFVRYEEHNTHATVSGLPKNDSFDRNDITVGLSYHIAPGVVVKGDHQWFDNAVEGNKANKQLNFGIGVWF